MGLHPNPLIKNVPGPTECRKVSVKAWLRDIYEQRTGKSRLRADDAPTIFGTMCRYGR